MREKSRIRPESDELMAYYRLHQNQHSQIADTLLIGRFSQNTMAELKRMVGEDEALLVESIARVCNFGDAKDLADLKRAVSKLLRERGTHLRRGKRPNMGLEKLVSTLAPVFIRCGIPSASSERSRLVTALRLVADDVGILGDPRDEVRRLLKLEKKYEQNAINAVLEAFSLGLNPIAPKE